VLLDIARESSDWFPPLKACLGGINALVKHYDVWHIVAGCSKALLTCLFQQSEDVKDTLEQLIPWLKKLLESPAKVDPNGDQQEVERRSQMARLVSSQSARYERPILCRSLEDIAQRLQALLAKGKFTRILDKTQDAQEVRRLIEQVRQTILVYQVGTKTRRDQVG